MDVIVDSNVYFHHSFYIKMYWMVHLLIMYLLVYLVLQQFVVKMMLPVYLILNFDGKRNIHSDIDILLHHHFHLHLHLYNFPMNSYKNYFLHTMHDFLTTS